MIIAGLQKLSLLDYPDKTCATVFTHGCNFRCPFCHNSPLVVGERADTVDTEEFFSFLQKRRGLLDGVCITGGEPLLQPDIAEFISRIKAMGFEVKLDTNGSLPHVLREVILQTDYVAMDIKNSLKKYSQTAGVEVDTEKICESVDIIRGSGTEYEFRTTVSRRFHTEEDIISIGKWLRGSKRYCIQNYRENENVISAGSGAFSENEILLLANFVKMCFDEVILRN